jgi:hypothetical protein
MNSRRVALLVMLAAFLVLLLAPLFMLENSSKAVNDQAYKQLHALGRSLAGDHSADSLAAEALESAVRVQSGPKTLYRIKGEKHCWELDPALSVKPIIIPCWSK